MSIAAARKEMSVRWVWEYAKGAGFLVDQRGIGEVSQLEPHGWHSAARGSGSKRLGCEVRRGQKR